MKDSKINYVIVGVFVISMLAATLVTIAALTGRTGATDTYYAVFSNVAGVLRGTQVQYEGYPIGQVTDIQPVRTDKDVKFRLVLTVEAGWPVPVDSLATIAASGLLSAVVVNIQGGASEALLPASSTIPAQEAGNLFSVMSNVAGEVTDLSQNSLKPLLANLNTQVTLLGDLLRENGPLLLGNLVAVTGDLKEHTPAITGNLAKFSADLNRAGEQLNTVLSDHNVAAIGQSVENVRATTESFARLAADLRGTQQQLDQVMVQLGEVVVANRGELEGSLHDLRRTLGTVSRSVGVISGDLENAARNLSEFTREVRRDPSQLLRGSPAGEEQPGRRR